VHTECTTEQYFCSVKRKIDVCMSKVNCLTISPVAMKKRVFFLLMSLAMLATMTSCNENADHPICGHTYENRIDIQNKGEWHHTSTKVTFHSNGKCTHYYYDNQLSFKSDTEEHLKWDVEGDQVLILRDKSTYWKKSARGTEWKRFTYNSSNNTLVSGSSVYTCVE